jgi:hypothetical protein
MPARAMQVRRDLYTSAIAPLAKKPPLMQGMAMHVRPDLYASAIAPLANQYWTTAAQPPLMPAKGDAGEARSLCICHSVTGQPVPDDKAKPPLMQGMAMHVRPDLYASVIAPLAN